MTKRAFFISLLFILTVPVFAQQHNRIAIYVPEETSSGVDNETKAYSIGEFTKYIRQDGKYIVINRSDEFKKAKAAEGAYQESGMVSDDELTRFGNESGVDYVCVIVFRKVFDRINIESRLIDVEKGYLIASDSRVLEKLSVETLNNEIKAMTGVLTGALGDKGLTLRSANDRLTYSDGAIYGYENGKTVRLSNHEVRYRMMMYPEALRKYDKGVKLYDEDMAVLRSVLWITFGIGWGGIGALLADDQISDGSLGAILAVSVPAGAMVLYGLSIPIVQRPLGRKYMSKSVDLYNSDVMLK